jgi:hypothetical protein
MIEKETEDLLQAHKTVSPRLFDGPKLFSGEASRRRSRQGFPISAGLSISGNHDDCLTVFRRVQLYEHTNRINSYEEAQEMLLLDPYSAPANLYMGWYRLVRFDPEAVHFLELATHSGMYRHPHCGSRVRIMTYKTYRSLQ